MSRTRPVAEQSQVYHTENRLLATMSPALAARIFPAMEQVSMTRGMVINESGVTQNHVYFPANAIVSLLYVLEDGASAETSMVGNDGMVGVSLVMGGGGTPSRAVVLIPGVGFRLPAQVLRRELEHHPELMRLLLRYIQTLMTQMAQTAVCYRHHSLRQQLCGLLLLTLDRLPSNTVAITHELIAHMLGVRREGVTEAAVQLQKAGVIRYSRGQIEVIDRPRLEEMACECYGVVKKECDRIMSLPL